MYGVCVLSRVRSTVRLWQFLCSLSRPSSLSVALCTALAWSTASFAQSDHPEANEMFVEAVQKFRAAENLPDTEKQIAYSEVRALLDKILLESPGSKPAQAILGENFTAIDLSLLQVTNPALLAIAPSMKIAEAKVEEFAEASPLGKVGVLLELGELILLARELNEAQTLATQILALPKWQGLLTTNAMDGIRSTAANADAASKAGVACLFLTPLLDKTIEGFVVPFLQSVLSNQYQNYAVSFLKESVDGACAAGPAILAGSAGSGGLLYPIAKTVEVLQVLEDLNSDTRDLTDETLIFAKAQLARLEAGSTDFGQVSRYKIDQDAIATELMNGSGLNVSAGRRMMIVNAAMLIKARQIEGRDYAPDLKTLDDIVAGFDGHAENLWYKWVGRDIGPLNMGRNGLKNYTSYAEATLNELGFDRSENAVDVVGETSPDPEDKVPVKSSPLGKTTLTISDGGAYFDPRYNEGLSEQGYDAAQHIGIDLPAPEGTAVMAPVAGIVLANYTNLADNFLKFLVVIDQLTGDQHVFGHITSDLSVGTGVNVGDQLGVIVRAGTGPHVHWGINSRVVPISAEQGWGWGRAPISATREQASERGWIDPVEWFGPGGVSEEEEAVAQAETASEETEVASPPASVAWISSSDPDAKLTAEQSADVLGSIPVAVSEDGSVVAEGALLFGPAPDPESFEIWVYNAPNGEAALVVQQDLDWGIIRAAVFSKNGDDELVAGLVPDRQVRGLAQPRDVRTPLEDIVWSPDGKYLAFPLRALEWQADLAVVERATGKKLVLTPDDLGEDNWAIPDMASLKADGSDWLQVTYEILSCRDTDCTGPSKVGEVGAFHNIAALMLSAIAPAAPLSDDATERPESAVSKEGDWGPDILVGLENISREYRPCLDASNVRSCLLEKGLSADAADFIIKVNAPDIFPSTFPQGFNETGALDVVHMEWRGASTSYYPILVNGSPKEIVVNSSSNLRAEFSDETSVKMLNAFPRAVSYRTSIRSHRLLDDGTQRFTVMETILDGCRGCPILGSAVTFIEIGPATGNQLRRRPIGLLLSPPNDQVDLTVDVIRNRPATLQVMLNALGYNAGAMDGFPGPQTRTALMAFQAEHCLPVTGQPDARTAIALKNADGFETPCRGAKPPEDVTAIKPLLSGIYVDDLEKCRLSALPSESDHLSQRIINGANITWGHEGLCTTDRTDIRSAVTQFRGTCYEADHESAFQWRFDVLANDRFVDLDMPTAAGSIPPRTYTKCPDDSVLRRTWSSWFEEEAVTAAGGVSGTDEGDNALATTNQDESNSILEMCTPTGSPSFPQRMMPEEDSSTHSGRTMSGKNWTLRLFSPGSAFGVAEFTNSAGTTAEGFWHPSRSGICQSYNGRESWSCHDLLACEGHADRFVMRNSAGEITSVLTAAVGPSYEQGTFAAEQASLEKIEDSSSSSKIRNIELEKRILSCGRIGQFYSRLNCLKGVNYE